VIYNCFIQGSALFYLDDLTIYSSPLHWMDSFVLSLDQIVGEMLYYLHHT